MGLISRLNHHPFQEHGNSHSHDKKSSHSRSRQGSMEHAGIQGSLTRDVAQPMRKDVPGRSSSKARAHPLPTHSDAPDSALYGHPVATRAALVQTAANMASAQSSSLADPSGKSALDSPHLPAASAIIFVTALSAFINAIFQPTWLSDGCAAINLRIRSCTCSSIRTRNILGLDTIKIHANSHQDKFNY